ncbi:MAG: nucleotidyltransferase family protein, partial [Petrimonas sp.]|nr:nucleotidyltransferase family protein [Petrimonas sp.]
GGGIKKASWFFDDEKPFLIHNVDILSDIDLQNLYHFHTSSNSVATLVVSERKTSRYLLFDKNNHLAGWINEKSGETKSPFSDFNADHYKKLAFSGIHILHPSILSYMQDFPDKFSIIDFYLFACSKEKIFGYIPNNLHLVDVGKINSIAEAEKFY